MAVGGLGGCADDPGRVITRLAVGSPGDDAYTLVPGTDRPDVVPRPQAGGETEGDAPGLYGGTRRKAACDPDALLRFLRRNPDKGKAWAAAHGLDFSQLPHFFQKLTPVILRVDTLVTNHGYKNGEPTAFPAVLQAGVGVLVDEYGRPAVKCNCGNPLTAPPPGVDPRKARYEGASWDRFDDRTVTVIRPRDRDKGRLTTITLVDPAATMSFTRPAGTTGEQDGPPAPLPPGESPAPAGGPSRGSAPAPRPTGSVSTAPPEEGSSPGTPQRPAPARPSDGTGEASGGPAGPGPGDGPRRSPTSRPRPGDASRSPSASPVRPGRNVS